MTSFLGTATIVGNLIGDPELKYSQGGQAYAKMTVAVSKKNKDKGTEATYFVDVTAFGKLAENTAASCSKGTRVVVFGDMDPQQWEKDGEVRRKFALLAIEIGPSLLYATAEVVKPERDAKPVGAPKQEALDPFADEEPF